VKECDDLAKYNGHTRVTFEAIDKVGGVTSSVSLRPKPFTFSIFMCSDLDVFVADLHGYVKDAKIAHGVR
jgi:hypothetical protein